MAKCSRAAVAGAAAVLSLVAFGASASADEYEVDEQSAKQAPKEVAQHGGAVVVRERAVLAPEQDIVTYEETVPNGGLIASGMVLFGISYGASVAVAATSEREEDRHLYIPVAGPWINLANRGSLPSGRQAGEVTNRVLLVADGVLQGLGALQIVGGFVFPTTRIVEARAGKPSLEVGLTGTGVAAFGQW